jgi:outer membrane protein assembly factor BamB
MRGMGRAVALVGAVTLLAGCWTQVGFGPAHRWHNDAETALTAENAATLTERWSAEVRATYVSEPMVSDGRVYVTRANSYPNNNVGARALDARTGATVWDTELVPGGSGVTSYPSAAVLSGGELWAGGAAVFTLGSIVRCGADFGRLDPSDGTVVATSPDDIYSPAVTAGDVVVQTTTAFGDPDGGFCINGAPLTVTVRDRASLAALWSAPVPGEQSGPLVPFYTLPTVADGRIYVANGSVLAAYALDGCGADTCEPLWSVDVGGTIDRSTPVAASGGRVVVTLTAGQVVAVEGSSGVERWRALLDVSPPIAPPLQIVAAAGDTAYVATAGSGTGQDRLLAYPMAGCGSQLCAPTWVGTSPLALTSPPTVAGGVVWVGAEGAVLAYDADGCGSSTCAPIANIPLAGRATSVTVALGRLYVSGPDHVTAFAPT